MPIITRKNAPPHLFAIPELDFAEDLFAEPLDGQWFRLASVTKNDTVNTDGVRDVTERQSLLLEKGAFEAIAPQLNAIGNALCDLGKPGESVAYSGASKKAYAYRPFHTFVLLNKVEGEPVAFIGDADGKYDLVLNPDIPLYFNLDEKPHGSGLWWDARRGVEVIRRALIDDGCLEFIEIRVDYLLKYLRARQQALVIGHYRHFHFFNPSQVAVTSFVQEDLVLHGSGSAKAILNNWGLRNDGAAGDPFLMRRLHLWFQIEPPSLDIERVFNEEPDFDVGALTLPVQSGEGAPAQFRQSALKEGQSLAGSLCNFLDRVYFRQEVLVKYQSASGFEIDDNGSVHCGPYWGLTRSTQRIGNELLSTYPGLCIKLKETGGNGGIVH